MKKLLSVSLFLLLLNSVGITQQTTLHKIGLSRVSTLWSKNETFIFQLTALNENQIITLDSLQQITYFPTALPSGTSYKIEQLFGPRLCTFMDSVTGTVGDADVKLLVNCGMPPTSIFKLKVIGVEPGERYIFTDGIGRTFYPTFNVTMNMGGFPQGDYYKITQTGGPRGCVLIKGSGIVPNHPDTVIADCRNPETPVATPAVKVDLVSRNSNNSQLYSYYESWAPVLGGKGEDEGRYVAFGAYGKGADGSSGNYRQIFWRDRKLGTTLMVSKAPDGMEGNGNSFLPSISADGQSVVFETYATNLTPADNNGLRDVFLWEKSSGRLTLISRSVTGVPANGASTEPVISGDGTTIVYTSGASDIVPLEPVFSTPNVYVYDKLSGNTTWISRDYETGKAASGYSPAVSEDGNTVVFCTYPDRLTPDDHNGLWDIFLWQRGRSELKRISVSSSRGERTQGTESSSRVIWPNISGDGNYVIYATTGEGLVPGDNNKQQDVFLYAVQTGEVKRLSESGNGIESDGDSPLDQGERIGISYDGKWVTYNTAATNLGVPKGNIIVQNTQTRQIIPVTNFTSGSSARPMISRRGHFVTAGCSEMYDKRYASSGLFVWWVEGVK